MFQTYLEEDSNYADEFLADTRDELASEIESSPAGKVQSQTFSKSGRHSARRGNAGNAGSVVSDFGISVHDANGG